MARISIQEKEPSWHEIATDNFFDLFSKVNALYKRAEDYDDAKRKITIVESYDRLSKVAELIPPLDPPNTYAEKKLEFVKEAIKDGDDKKAIRSLIFAMDGDNYASDRNKSLGGLMYRLNRSEITPDTAEKLAGIIDVTDINKKIAEHKKQREESAISFKLRMGILAANDILVENIFGKAVNILLQSMASHDALKKQEGR